MGYEPETYWPERFAKEGAAYVARRGMSRSESHAQAARFAAHLPGARGKNVLDYGCGVGRMFAPLSEANTYVGVDICELALDIARADPKIPSHALFVAPSVLDGYSDNTFDLTVAVTVLQHVPKSEIGRVLALLRRVTYGRVCIIDSAEFDSTAEHMFPRKPEEYAEALGLTDWTHSYIDVDHEGSHYVLTGTAG